MGGRKSGKVAKFLEATKYGFSQLAWATVFGCYVKVLFLHLIHTI
jgi:hypothetical protein